MHPVLHPHVAQAIKRLSDYLSYEGCNDYEMSDTPENRALWDEYQAWNLKVPLEQLAAHPEYYVPTARRGQLCIHDGVLIYSLKKAAGMLDLKD